MTGETATHHHSNRLKPVYGKWLAVGYCCMMGLTVHAQYYQFSQYNFTAQRVNPALLGTARYATLDFDSRSQKTGGDFNINSNFFALSYPLLNQSTGQAWGGIGITALDDRAGGIFKTQEVSASYALNVRLSRYQLLSFGVKGLYQSTRLSLDGFYTGSQYLPDHGFSNSLSSGETFAESRAHYATFSTGLYWQNVDRRGNMTSYWGLSLFDINRPTYTFTGHPEQLPSTFVFTGGFQAYKKNAWVIFPELLYTRNSGNNTANVGARFQYSLRALPNQVPDRIDILTKYVVGRSGIIGLQLHRENFSAGLSYDFPLFTTNPGNIGAFEVGITLRKLVLSKVRRVAKQQQEEKKKKGIPPTKQALVKTDPRDSTTVATSKPAEVEIIAVDTTHVATEVSVGKISQEPLLVEKITLHFNFEYNSVDLDDETEKYLSDLAVTLGEDKKLKLTITGHTDNIGPEKFNQRLSLRRADAVRDFLLKQGIDMSRLQTDGKGMTKPLNKNETEEDRARNRRVEIEVFR